ncbi:lipocalin family protein [Aromatoleum petrolei]|uniref:Outer membrane lipoprotein Blc n=1 Tax=Aromatoleum petrolei TaxID=76116 RepID=A0ABX1MVM3_9RHOO|nr:lipocalin family protein [Aromatoleum petrolei]NMF89142.1 lipocalin [Aromatoleum petrolei]QTQ36540.1 Outer membrane lipoprotein [Aromatoleum petrolei]
MKPARHSTVRCSSACRTIRSALLALTLLTTQPLSAHAGAQPAELTTIATLDVPRYMGTWYEIAKYPNRFQRHCAGFTQAEYRLQEDGRVQVANRCRTAEGRVDEAIGTARQIGDANSPRLKVRFAPAWLSFLPWVWGDYWVIDLDTDYRLAAVSEPGREYLWILSRTPTVEPQALEALRARLATRGFDLSRLEMTRQQD